MAKIKLKEKLRGTGTPVLMHVSREGGHVSSPKHHGNVPGDTPVVFPPGYANRKARRNTWHRKKQAKAELRSRLMEKGVNHNTAGVMARVLMSNPPKATEPEAES
jgi:hypothetical protein